MKLEINKDVDKSIVLPDFEKSVKNKPFLKWAGGKGKLLKILDKYMPRDFSKKPSITYVEPFVGGGAMLFHMLDSFPNINRVIINDINEDLINCYRTIKDDAKLAELIVGLESIREEYVSKTSQEERNEYYYSIRARYNSLRHEESNEENLFKRAIYFIFLNHTCFNGLYRENSKGDFNVPSGKYQNPMIYNEGVLKSASKTLKRVDILCGSFDRVKGLISGEEYTFIYLDPPYRPMLGADSFKDYTKHEFADEQQELLKAFCDSLSSHDIMISNSNSINEDGSDYFANLYKREEGYNMHKILAPRSINSNGDGRSKLYESLITNYKVE